MAKEFLSSVSLASCLPSTPLVSVTTGCRLDAAIRTLRENTILSCPVLKGGEYQGCISVNDVLRSLMAELRARQPHWFDTGASAFSADDLVAVGKSLLSKSVGELEHAGSLYLLNAHTNSSLLDFVVNSFDIRDSHHVHHRVYVCLAAGTSHTVESGFTTVVNATKQSAASGKLTVTHVVSQRDVIRQLAANKGALGISGQTLEALGLDEGAVFCVPATTPALEAFGRMVADQKSCLGLTDPATGKLVGTLSASDVRGLSTPESFASLLAPAADLRAKHYGGSLPPVGTVTPATTFGDLLDMLVANLWHRVYVVDGEGRPTSIITLTDILRCAAA